LLGDRPATQVEIDALVHVVAYSEATGGWEDLGLPASLGAHTPGSGLGLFGAHDSLFLITSAGAVARYRDGAWRVLGSISSSHGTVVETEGNVYVLDFAAAFRVDGDALVPAFEELAGRGYVRDVLRIGDVTYVSASPAYSADFEAPLSSLFAISNGVA